ncbi:hypothetical protein [Candidatus Lokiarchaeum ossiferum]|uniref:hypothetical protein n=1 Tax=Candidatus Lokiarchaeum ossiferum TaxID=2951803 RepID=UPI00352C8A9D
MIIQSQNLKTILYEQTFMVVYRILKQKGPVPWLTENVDCSNNILIENLQYAGITYSFIIGQGHNYFTGLFGPIPFKHKNYRCLIYSGYLKSQNNGFNKKEYVLISFFLPAEIISLLINYNSIEKSFEKFVNMIKDIEYLSKMKLLQLRLNIIQNFTQNMDFT